MIESSMNRQFMLFSKRRETHEAEDEERAEEDKRRGVAPKKKKPVRQRFLQLQVGDEVPDFAADSTVGTFNFHDMVDGVWSVLVSFPAGCEAVATTEMGQLSKLAREFEARNVRLVGVACGSKEDHRHWIDAVEARAGIELGGRRVVRGRVAATPRLPRGSSEGVSRRRRGRELDRPRAGRREGPKPR